MAKDLIKLVTETYQDLVDASIRSEFLDWVRALASSGINDDFRLLSCLGIEIKNNIVDIKCYIRIFNKMNYASVKKKHLLFEDTLKANKHLHFFSNQFSNLSSIASLVRVMDLPTFSEFFFNRSDYDDLTLANDLRVLKGQIQLGFLHNLGMPNDGPPFREIAWVTTYSSLREIIDEEGVSGRDPTNEVLRRLGLSPLNLNDDYIYMEYPLNFGEETYQPCAVNGRWDLIDGLYISYKKNNLQFGNTRPQDCDTEMLRQKERVHLPIKDFREYDIHYLGIFRRKNLNTTTICSDCVARFNES